jgi:hypothetical protein
MLRIKMIERRRSEDVCGRKAKTLEVEKQTGLE